MRVRLLGLWLPLVFACSGTNVVAGPERTEAERIEASLPTWCAEICSELQACPASDCACEGEGCTCAIVDDCPHECRAYFSAAIHKSAACAAMAGRAQRCYDAQGCAVLERACREQEDELINQCDDQSSSGESEPDPPQGANGGSSSAGPAPSTGPAPPYVGPPVTCEEGGGEGSAEPDATGVLCEEQRADCVDGRDYLMVCVATSTGQRVCSCLVNGVVTGAFGPGESCPTLAEINAGCGWRLAEL